jgi:hypothetical protein
MTTPDAQAIEDFLRQQYGLWNEGKMEELKAVFRDIAPGELSIQYVGQDPQDGWQALDEMWELYGGKCTIDIVEILVNGNEAATYVLNNLSTDNGVQAEPSIETYRFEQGNLWIRYFHRVRE